MVDIIIFMFEFDVVWGECFSCFVNVFECILEDIVI